MKLAVGQNQNLISYYLFFSLNLSLVFIFKLHFDKLQNPPPGEPREHHLGVILQERSKSKLNITVFYSIVLFF